MNRVNRRFSFRAIWSGEFLGRFGGIAAIVVCFCSCNLFGPDFREIAGGYRLKRSGNPDQFVLTIPYEEGGMIIDEIGWRKPIIVARSSGSEYWDVINTVRGEHIRVSDQKRKSDPVYQTIQIERVLIAWRELSPSKRLW